MAAAVIAGALWSAEILSIPRRTARFVYDDIERVPKRRVGLLLGCSSRLSDGRPNPFFGARVDAAARLYHAGKIDYVLVSGDNRTPQYNEPAMLRRALALRAVPDDRIVSDYAGRRTLDSVVRAHEVFGLDTFTIISQRFHNERAVYLASGFGAAPVAFDADDAPGWAGRMIWVREAVSRAAAVLEVRVLRTRPHFLGPHVAIGA